jgi:3-dehydroquinate dehydratase
MPNAIFIFEFKTDGEGALRQIKDKRYHEKYGSLNKPIYLVGIEFSSGERNVVKVDWEKVVEVL